MGARLYKLLTGHAPFGGPNYATGMKKMFAHLTEPVPPVRGLRAEVSEPLAAVIDRMLAKKPEDRISTAAEVAVALAPFAAGADLHRLAAAADGNANVAALSSPHVLTEPFLPSAASNTTSSHVGPMADNLPSPSPAGGEGKGLPSPSGRGAGGEGGRRRIVAIGLAGAAALAIVAMTIIIHYRDKQGQQRTVEAADDSPVTVEHKPADSATAAPSVPGTDSKSQISNLKSETPPPSVAPPPIGDWFTLTQAELLRWPALHDGQVTSAADGVLSLTGKTIVNYRIVAKDACIRARVKKLPGHSVVLRLRGSDDGQRFVSADFLGGNTFFIIQKSNGGKEIELAKRYLKQNYDDSFLFEFRAIGDQLTLLADGHVVVEARDPETTPGMPAIGTWNASAEFSKIEVLIPTKESLVADNRGRATDEELRANPLAGTPVLDGTKEPKKLLALLKPGQWVSLFDGKTLAGWKTVQSAEEDGPPGEVRASNGQITLDQAPKTWTSLVWQGEFPTTDYELLYEFQHLGGGATVTDFPVGQSQFRADCQSEAFGVERRKDGVSSELYSALFSYTDQWQRVQTRVSEGRIQAWLNGRKVADLPAVAALLSAGAINLKGWPLHFGTCTAAGAVRNVYIRRIGAADADAAPLPPRKPPFMVGKPLPPPKPIALDIRHEPLPLPAGEPLSANGAVPRPASISGLRSWALETVYHRGAIEAIAFSPDSRLLATAGADGAVRLWNVEDRRLVRMLLGHECRVWSITWSPDGKYLASAGQDKSVRIWSVQSRTASRVFRQKKQPIRAVAWSPDGEILANAGEDGVIYLWDAAREKASTKLAGHEGPVLCLAWSPDGTLLASGGQDCNVRIWDRKSGKCRNLLGAEETPVADVSWSPDGELVVCSGRDWQREITDVREARTGSQLFRVFQAPLFTFRKMVARRNGAGLRRERLFWASLSLPLRSGKLRNDGSFSRWSVAGGWPRNRCLRARFASSGRRHGMWFGLGMGSRRWPRWQPSDPWLLLYHLTGRVGRISFSHDEARTSAASITASYLRVILDETDSGKVVEPKFAPGRGFILIELDGRAWVGQR